MPLHAVALNCTLKPGPEQSSSARLLELVAAELHRHDVETTTLRVIDEHVSHGVSSDEGDGDGWPSIRRRISASGELTATPISDCSDKPARFSMLPRTVAFARGRVVGRGAR